MENNDKQNKRIKINVVNAAENGNKEAGKFSTQEYYRLMSKKKKSTLKSMTFDISTIHILIDLCQKQGSALSTRVNQIIVDYLRESEDIDMRDPKNIEKGYQLYFVYEFKQAVNKLYQSRKFDDFGHRRNNTFRSMDDKRAQKLIATAQYYIRQIDRNMRDERVVNYQHDLERAIKFYQDTPVHRDEYFAKLSD